MSEQETEVKTKPTGTMKVEPELPEAGKPKRKLYPLLKKLAAAVPAAAILITAAFVVYDGTKTITPEESETPELHIGIETAGYFTARENKACGWWTIADYV